MSAPGRSQALFPERISAEGSPTTTVPSGLLLDTLACLQAISALELAPPQACRRLQEVGQPHAGIKLDLLWEREEADGGWHYDALLRLPQGGTVSLSHCPDRALPWPMRGARRFSDGHLLRVNDTVVTVEEAMGHLDVLLDDSAIRRRLVDACLVKEELVRHPVEVSQEELRHTMDAFRRARRLYSADACRRWVERRGLTHERFEALVADCAAVGALRRRLTADRVPGFFDAHRGAFDVAHAAQIAYRDADEAEQAHARIARGVVDFLAAAQARFVAAGAHEGVETFVAVRRGLDPSPLSEAVFRAAPGDVVGPVACDSLFLVLRVWSVIRAALDDGVRDHIQRLLFDQWLSERRQAAQVEWFWHDPC